MNMLLLLVILLGTATFCLDTLPDLDPDSQTAQVRGDKRTRGLSMTAHQWCALLIVECWGSYTGSSDLVNRYDTGIL
jgi:hypothetical protein